MELDITDREFNELRELIHQLIGITLNENKKMLVISRLSKRLKTLKLQDFAEYLQFLKSSKEADEELVELINSITTNKTDFFREPHHFQFLRDQFLPGKIMSLDRDLRIWSAGCSSGEEPYTIAMVIDRFFAEQQGQGHGRTTKILATDVDTTVLEKARKGEYRADHCRDIPPEYRRYCLKTPTEGVLAMDARLKNLITFGRFNLMHPLPFKHGFDIVFCRNVLIYFNQDDRMSIIRKYRSVLRPGGILILGHSESLLADQAGFINLGNTVYQKNGS